SARLGAVGAEFLIGSGNTAIGLKTKASFGSPLFLGYAQRLLTVTRRLMMANTYKNFRLGLCGFLAALVLLHFSPVAYATGEKTTIYVDGGGIFTAAAEPLVMRGFNEMFVWSNDKTGERWLPEMGKTGANSVRLVWDHQFPKDELVRLIENAIDHKMVAIPECHNATGKWGDALQACVDFWNNPVLLEAIERNRRWTILNIANEAGDYSISDEDFLATYSAATQTLCCWGYTVPLMIT